RRHRSAWRLQIVQRVLLGPWLPGCLAPRSATDTLWRALLDLAGDDLDHQRRLLRLATPPADQVGVALFPVALNAHCGSIRQLRVVEAGRIVAHPADEGTRQALDLARRWVSSATGTPLSLLQTLHFAVSPQLPSDHPIEGGSMGWAAVVALMSWLLRRPVRGGLVFTGALQDTVQGPRAAPVRPETISAKLLATRHHGAAQVLVLHRVHASDVQLPVVSGPGIRGLDELSEVVMHAIGPWTEAARDLHARLGRPPQPTSWSLVGRRLLAVLSFTAEPLSAGQLEQAATAGVWHEPLRAHPVIGAELEALERAGKATRSGGTWALAAEERYDTRALFVDQSWEQQAHEALACALAGGEPTLRAHHLLAAGRLADAAEAMHTALCADFPAAARRIEALGPRGFKRLLAALPQDAETTWSLRIARAGLRLPPPAAAAARRLAEQPTPAARLLTAQALAELLLHLLAEAAVALDAVDRRRLQGLRLRPSLGLLAQCAAALWGRRGADHPVRDTLRTHLEPLGPLHDRLSPLSQLLHGAPGIDTLVNHPERAEEAMCDSGPVLCELVTRCQSALAELKLELNEALDALHLSTPDGATLKLPVRAEAATAEILWHRGTIDGDVRWWSMSSCASQGPVRTPPVAKAPNLAQLPLPVAHMLRRMQRADDNLDRLAALELCLHSLLRIALFTDTTLTHKQLKRLNCRRLLDFIRHAPPSPVRSPLLGGSVEGLLPLLERLQHAPGPLEAWTPLLVEATAWLHAAIGQLPWCVGAMHLDGGGLRFMGMHTVPSPHPGPPTLIGEDGHLHPLGELAQVRDGALWLFRQLDRPPTYTTTRLEQNRLTQHTRSLTPSA
ncbi:MAG: hypothetical protein ACI8S6_004832, partial [Myxococcota bacterium]